MSERVFRMVKNTVKIPVDIDMSGLCCVCLQCTIIHTCIWVVIGLPTARYLCAWNPHHTKSRSSGPTINAQITRAHVHTYSVSTTWDFQTSRRVHLKAGGAKQTLSGSKAARIILRVCPPVVQRRAESDHCMCWCVYVCHSEFKEATFGIVLRECWRVLYKHWERLCV